MIIQFPKRVTAYPFPILTERVGGPNDHIQQALMACKNLRVAIDNLRLSGFDTERLESRCLTIQAALITMRNSDE